MFILSSLPVIDLLNISACSKMFYRLARDDEAFKIKFKDSHSLAPCADLFDRYYDQCVSFNWELSDRLQKCFDEDLMFVVSKKIMNNLIFDIFRFRIFHHLFYCDRGFYVYNKLVCFLHKILCQRKTSFWFFKSKYFRGIIFPVILVLVCFWTIFFLFLHYTGIIYSSRDNYLENNYGGFGVLYYEETDRPFFALQFLFGNTVSCGFNNVLKKVVPKKLNDFDHNTDNICRHKSFCDRKSCSGKEKKILYWSRKLLFLFLKLSV